MWGSRLHWRHIMQKTWAAIQHFSMHTATLKCHGTSTRGNCTLASFLLLARVPAAVNGNERCLADVGTLRMFIQSI